MQKCHYCSRQATAMSVTETITSMPITLDIMKMTLPKIVKKYIAVCRKHDQKHME